MRSKPGTDERGKVEAMQALGQAGIQASASFDVADLAHDPHMPERDMVVSYKHPVRHGQHSEIADTDVGVVRSPAAAPACVGKAARIGRTRS